MLCPRRCGADRAAGRRGVCGAGAQVRVARAALHFWEEPPISGESGSGTVFFSHCPLHCVYCQNACIANGQAGADISVRRLARIFLELQGKGALNVNLVTGTHYVPQIIEALDLARAAGLALPVVYNTSGYETPETIRLLSGRVDCFLSDFRYFDAATARAYSHAPDYPEVAKEALVAMTATGARVIVRVLLLPGHEAEAERIVSFVHDAYGHLEQGSGLPAPGIYADDGAFPGLPAGCVRLSLMSQYTPVGDFPDHPELSRRVDPAAFERLLDFADAIGCDEYFWQDGDAAEESFIPDFFGLEGVKGPEL